MIIPHSKISIDDNSNTTRIFNSDNIYCVALMQRWLETDLCGKISNVTG
jgi:hypothetical protein